MNLPARPPRSALACAVLLVAGGAALAADDTGSGSTCDNLYIVRGKSQYVEFQCWTACPDGEQVKIDYSWPFPNHKNQVCVGADDAPPPHQQERLAQALNDIVRTNEVPSSEKMSSLLNNYQASRSQADAAAQEDFARVRQLYLSNLIKQNPDQKPAETLAQDPTARVLIHDYVQNENGDADALIQKAGANVYAPQMLNQTREMKIRFRNARTPSSDE